MRSRKVAGLLVGSHARGKVVSNCCAPQIQGQRQVAQVGGSKAQVGWRAAGSQPAARPGGGRSAAPGRCELERVELLQPGALGGEHAVGRTFAGSALRCAPAAPGLGSRSKRPRPAVPGRRAGRGQWPQARSRGWSALPARPGCAPAARWSPPGPWRTIAATGGAAARRAGAASSSAATLAWMNSTRRSLRVGGASRDVGIEHESAVHALEAAQCVVQGGMVVAAQIAAHPHQGSTGYGANLSKQRKKGLYLGNCGSHMICPSLVCWQPHATPRLVKPPPFVTLCQPFHPRLPRPGAVAAHGRGAGFQCRGHHQCRADGEGWAVHHFTATWRFAA